MHRFITSCICTFTTLQWWSQQEPCVAVIVDQYSAAAALKFILVLNALPRPIQSYCGGPHWGMCGLYTALLQQPAPSVRHQHGRDGWQNPSSLQKSASPPKYNNTSIQPEPLGYPFRALTAPVFNIIKHYYQYAASGCTIVAQWRYNRMHVEYSFIIRN